MKIRGTLFALFLSALCALGGKLEDYASNVAPLIDPAKLSTLGVRGANPRVQKTVYWLATAKGDKADPSKVMALALKDVGMTNALAAELTRKAALRNLDIAQKLGCLDAEGLAEMRRGKSPTIRRGPYAGQELSVDHIIPRSVVPELDNVIANLELLPLRLNQSKNSTVGERQIALGEKLFKAGLLSEEGIKALRKPRSSPKRADAPYRK